MKNILVIRFSALGDVAMLAQVIKIVAAEHTDCHYTVMSQPFCEPLFDSIAPNVSFLGINVKKDYKGIPGLWRLFRKLHSMHFDEIIDEHDVLRTKVLRLFFHMHGYKVRKLDKHRQLRKEITAPEGKKNLRQLPTSFENYAEALGESLNQAQRLNPSNPSNLDDKAIGIAPFAAHKGKIYPLERMEQVVRRLCEDNNTVILFCGKGREAELMQQWTEKYPCATLASDYLRQMGKTPCLREELQLMKQLRVMISMDSANMHLASLVGTRVVSLWGATHPYAGFLGWNQSPTDCIQRNDLKCRPCSIYGNKPCIYGDNRCMDISPDSIYESLSK